jgi:hypothetical protein
MADEKDPVEDYIKEIEAQFKAMHTDLDGLEQVTKTSSKEEVKATREQTKAIKEQTKFAKEEVKQAKVQTSQSKAQSATLKEMQKNLHRMQMQQGASMADVAAEHLAGGGGLGGAMKAAAGLKVAQFKHRFDPLNIIKKMTGGSRLAVALAGKVTGRKESTIREFADLAPAEEGGLPSSIFGKKSSFGGPSRMEGGMGGGGAERMDGGKGGLLGKIADTLTKILSRVTGLEVMMQVQTKMDQTALDAAKDEAAEEGAKGKPSKVGGLVGKAKAVGSDIMKFLTDLIGKIKIGLIGAFVLLGVAAAMLRKQWDKLKLSFSLLKDSAVDMWNGIKQAFSDAGTWIADTTNNIIDNIADVFDSIVQGIQEMLAKIPFVGKPAPTKEEQRANLEASAKGGSASAARRLAKQDAEAAASPAAVGGVLSKLAPQFASKIPADSKAAAAKSLQSGSLNAEAVGALTKGESIKGSPEKVSTGGALTQLTSAAYEQTFGVTPTKDTKENRESRVPAMVQQASQSLASAIAPAGGAVQVSEAPQMVPQTAPGAPIMTAQAPTVGMDLNNAAEARRNAEAVSPTGIIAPMTNVSKTVNNTSATTINQGMAPARSGEDSHQRAFEKMHAVS